MLLDRVAVGYRPNGLAYDPTRRRLFVFNIGDPPGVNCTVSVVAVDELRVIATVPLPGRARWAVYDAVTEHVYANVQKPAQSLRSVRRTSRSHGLSTSQLLGTWLGDFWRSSFLRGRWRSAGCAGS